MRKKDKILILGLLASGLVWDADLGFKWSYAPLPWWLFVLTIMSLVYVGLVVAANWRSIVKALKEVD